MEKKLLIAFDNSENAMKAVEVVGDTFTKDHKVTILSIIPDTAAVCSICGSELSPHFMSQKDAFCAMEERHKTIMKEAQEKARQLLIKKGFPSENIALKITTIIKGVAKDIVHESMSGYDTVVMGRRGISSVKEFFLGSVSHKVISISKDISILVVE
ncbi:MAG: universal stress protein [Bacteroidales bacterium]|nr:universal stress protein [Bacteroidales bacterium]